MKEKCNLKKKVNFFINIIINKIDEYFEIIT